MDEITTLHQRYPGSFGEPSLFNSLAYVHIFIIIPVLHYNLDSIYESLKQCRDYINTARSSLNAMIRRGEVHWNAVVRRDARLLEYNTSSIDRSIQSVQSPVRQLHK